MVEDHPRVCGEKHYKISQNYAVNRITPAYAGKRNSSSAQMDKIWDHPRVCGEKTAAGVTIAVALGSPPRMRGKAELYKVFAPESRITPAYAGKRRKHSFG